MRLLIACAATLLLAACASYDGRGLVPGTSTAKEVEAVMGQPHQKLAVAGGDDIWFYSRQPFGRRIFAVRLAPDGTLRGIEQTLTRENVDKVRANVDTMKDVRERFGPPFDVGRLPLMPRVTWEYWMYEYDHWPKRLIVQFSDDGIVREVMVLRDPSEDGANPGGRN
jgi:hypothetical protein